MKGDTVEREYVTPAPAANVYHLRVWDDFEEYIPIIAYIHCVLETVKGNTMDCVLPVCADGDISGISCAELLEYRDQMGTAYRWDCLDCCSFSSKTDAVDHARNEHK